MDSPKRQIRLNSNDAPTINHKSPIKKLHQRLKAIPPYFVIKTEQSQLISPLTNESKTGRIQPLPKINRYEDCDKLNTIPLNAYKSHTVESIKQQITYALTKDLICISAKNELLFGNKKRKGLYKGRVSVNRSHQMSSISKDNSTETVLMCQKQLILKKDQMQIQKQKYTKKSQILALRSFKKVPQSYLQSISCPQALAQRSPRSIVNLYKRKTDHIIPQTNRFTSYSPWEMIIPHDQYQYQG